ncbi:Nucleolar protein 12 [Sporothrix eucalyptigena]|uniref:Nucleolar protein 12 n=1 Tax=Sporothrix eucalyptigena TaxID=1812306 RepID=A0ABP0B5Y3_9PEZI
MAPSKSPFAAPKKAVDPTLDALFASSVGPVEARAKPKYEPLVSSKPRAAPTAAPVKPLTKEEEEAAAEDSEDDEEDEDDDDDNDEEDNDEEEDDDSSDKEESSAEEEAPAALVDLKSSTGKRKRKNRDENDDLESRYFDKLEKEIDGPAEKKTKREADGSDEEMTEAKADSGEDSEDDDKPIIHESLLNGDGGTAADGTTNDQIDEQDKAKADRTVFLSNVSITAITNKAAKKTLIAHLESIADDKSAKGKKNVKDNGDNKDEENKEDKAKEDDKTEKRSIVESLRFRSVPFASAALPKRASYITKAVMGATAQSTNAYVVYTTAAQARAAVRKLNGTVVLDRHLRADSVSHPSPVDHRRCVFVGNLGFVDDETVLSANPEADGENGGGEMTRKKRNKTPMDIDEGLWRTFGKHAGKVESVRVIRDQATRVGKGFAYVQFYDATSVEAALLLADKKFPPLLPRALRVSRCKAPYKTARALERVQLKANGKPGGEAGGPGGKRDGRDSRKNDAGNGTTGYKPKLTAEQQTSAGRASKLLGKSAATTPLAANGPDGKPIVFEGMRARVGGVNLFKKGKGKKINGGRNSGPPGKDASRKQVRQAGRAANWRAKKGGDA